MKRLVKKSNHVSPNMHNEVQKAITDPDNNRWKVQQSQDAFLISKKLLSSLPIVETNERVYQLAQDIVIGEFDDISPVEDATLPENWDKWRQRTVDLLRSKGILVSSRLIKNKREGD